MVHAVNRLKVPMATCLSQVPIAGPIIARGQAPSLIGKGVIKTAKTKSMFKIRHRVLPRTISPLRVQILPVVLAPRQPT